MVRRELKLGHDCQAVAHLRVLLATLNNQGFFNTSITITNWGTLFDEELEKATKAFQSEAMQRGFPGIHASGEVKEKTLVALKMFVFDFAVLPDEFWPPIIERSVTPHVAIIGRPVEVVKPKKTPLQILLYLLRAVGEHARELGLAPDSIAALEGAIIYLKHLPDLNSETPEKNATLVELIDDLALVPGQEIGWVIGTAAAMQFADALDTVRPGGPRSRLSLGGHSTT